MHLESIQNWPRFVHLVAWRMYITVNKHQVSNLAGSAHARSSDPAPRPRVMDGRSFLDDHGLSHEEVSAFAALTWTSVWTVLLRVKVFEARMQAHTGDCEAVLIASCWRT